VIIANSAYTASRVALYTSNKHIAVVHPGIDEPAQDTILYEQTRSIIGGNKPVLITIARLEKRKGHQQVIDLLPALIKDFPDLVYIIVGEGPCHSGLVSQVKSHALQDHVQFVGTLMGAEKNAYLNNSDVFVMPGIEAGDDIEGYGIAYIEAGYFGVPSIASELGGASDAVDHEKTGLVCVPADMSCLERSLRKLISDKDCRNLLGNGARRKARERLWPARIKDYTKLFFET
jgi:phosphatidylinositol alpha-1,6-mannosyltransferase